VDDADAGWVEGAIGSRAGAHVRLESAKARICRAELLVEVEGVAAL
jgi:hypothetical protein